MKILKKVFAIFFQAIEITDPPPPPPPPIFYYVNFIENMYNVNLTVDRFICIQ